MVHESLPVAEVAEFSRQIVGTCIENVKTSRPNLVYLGGMFVGALFGYTASSLAAMIRSTPSLREEKTPHPLD